MRNRVIEKEIPAALLNIYEFCDYLSIGETKARELLHDPGNGFTVRIGNRLYAHKGSRITVMILYIPPIPVESIVKE